MIFEQYSESESQSPGILPRGHDKPSPTEAPMLSVITVAYNASTLIEKTILSVLELTYENIEYIVIDGGSSDGTLDIIKKYAHKIDYWVSEKDRGIYDAMNKGIMRAKGEWINFMNCGDRFLPGHSLHFLRKVESDVDIVYGDAIVEYSGFNSIYVKAPLKEMWRRMPFCHQATFVRTALMKQWTFDLKYRLSSDYDFLYKAYAANKKFMYVSETICYFDFKGGASKKHALRSVRERRSIVLSHGFELKKWIYYNVSIVYVFFTFFLKGLIGNKLTLWATRLLKA